MSKIEITKKQAEDLADICRQAAQMHDTFFGNVEDFTESTEQFIKDQNRFMRLAIMLEDKLAELDIQNGLKRVMSRNADLVDGVKRADVEKKWYEVRKINK